MPARRPYPTELLSRYQEMVLISKETVVFEYRLSLCSLVSLLLFFYVSVG